MITLTPNIRGASQLMHGSEPWIWLYELIADRALVSGQYIETLFRLCSFPEQIAFGGKTYYPFPVIHTSVVQDGEGNLPQFDITLSNVTRELAPYLEIGAGFMHQKCVLQVVHKAYLASASDVAFSTSGRISGCTLSKDTIVFRLEDVNLYDWTVPQEFFTRDRCPFVYKGEYCRYRGPLATCKRDIPDCTAHGNEMAGRGYPRLHPGRFGGQPGLPLLIA